MAAKQDFINFGVVGTMNRIKQTIGSLNFTCLYLHND